jgi:hypothetical protein
LRKESHDHAVLLSIIKKDPPQTSGNEYGKGNGMSLSPIKTKLTSFLRPVSLLSLATTLLLCSCVTPQYKRFVDVKVGMEKDQVLEAAGGGPTRTNRVDSEDRWTYVMPKDGDFITKEVRFREGKSTFVGDPQPALISAEEQDKINAATNAALDAQDKAAAEQVHENTRQVLEGSDTSRPSLLVPSTAPAGETTAKPAKSPSAIDEAPPKQPNWELIH